MDGLVSSFAVELHPVSIEVPILHNDNFFLGAKSSQLSKVDIPIGIIIRANEFFIVNSDAANFAAENRVDPRDGT